MSHARGTYGEGLVGSPRARALVGISLFHTVGDRDRLVDQVDTEFGQLYAELFRKMGGDPSLLSSSGMYPDVAGWARRYQAAQAGIKHSPLYALWSDTVVPVWNEWKNFYKEQSSWEEWKTNWETYEGWRDRVAALHAHVASEVARLLPGQPIRTPPPSGAPRTVWEQAGCAISSGAGDAWKFAKYAAYAGLAIGGLFVVGKVVEGVRSKS